MTDKESILLHLTSRNYEINGLTYFSSFWGGLRDARKMTGRNLETGVKDNSNTFGHFGSWLGAIGYLSILEQIGNCFEKINGPITEANKSGIIKALKNFSDLNDDNKIDALYALRNCFVHDFSLQNIGKSQSLIHHFIVDNSSTNSIVILPLQKWDGIIINKNSLNRTYINLQALGDMIENLILNLITLVYNNEVEITLAGGKEELINKYSLVSGKMVIIG